MTRAFARFLAHIAKLLFIELLDAYELVLGLRRQDDLG